MQDADRLHLGVHAPRVAQRDRGPAPNRGRRNPPAGLLAGRANPGGMEHSTASRRLVKSGPKLWGEISDEPSLARHLAEFGEIRITRVTPETTVAWEGDRVSGTVELARIGLGTKVGLTATEAEPPPLGPDDTVATPNGVLDVLGDTQPGRRG